MMTFDIIEMPKWKHRILNSVAWILGFRGENVWVITVTKGFEEELKKDKNNDA